MRLGSILMMGTALLWAGACSTAIGAEPQMDAVREAGPQIRLDALLPEGQFALASMSYVNPRRSGDWWMAVRADTDCIKGSRPLTCRTELVAYRVAWRVQVNTDIAALRRAAETNSVADGVAWEMAVITQCPGAKAVFDTLTERDWVQFSLDTTSVYGFRVITQMDGANTELHLPQTTYRGPNTPNSPGEWVGELNAALEMCWQPADIAAPWDE